jgi:hypothetical protein
LLIVTVCIPLKPSLKKCCLWFSSYC